MWIKKQETTDEKEDDVNEQPRSSLSSGNKSTRTGSATDDDELVSSIPKPSLIRLVGLARPEYPVLLVTVVLMIASEGIGMYNPLLLGDAYDYLIDPSLDGSERMKKINRTMGTVLIIHTISILMYFARVSVLRIIGERVVARVRTTLYQSLLKQEISFFDQHKSGEHFEGQKLLQHRRLEHFLVDSTMVCQNA